MPDINEDVSIKKFDVVETLKDGIGISIKNIGPILVNFLLWAMTLWIPYLNIGTTIGMFTGIVSKASRGETIPFTEIFDPKYRKYMGEYFLTIWLISIGVFTGLFFFILPGIIIFITWNFALLLVIDKGKNPAAAITLSNNITYGSKGRMFLIYFIVSLIFSVILTILGNFDSDFMAFLAFISFVFSIFVFIGIQASMYKQLAGNV
jgi:hypothetical protein